MYQTFPEQQRVAFIILEFGMAKSPIAFRAKRVAKFLDAKPEPFTLLSDRGFLTITGTYQGTPVSIIAIGMGAANMDFFVRECRESVFGDMAIVRLGSCGGLLEDLPVGSLTVPRAAVAITRNYDYDFTSPADDGMLKASTSPNELPYRISRPVEGNQQLRESLVGFLETTRDDSNRAAIARGDVVNAACDGLPSAPQVPSLTTTPAILTREPGAYFILGAHAAAPSFTLPTELSESPSRITGGIYASSVHIIFAQRTSSDFISPKDAESRERWAGKACLETLKAFDVKNTHPDESSVWAV
ncbi:hypothetical protein FRB96_009052 [Tulasnella sp. 330]|nr:hypothetical protein FRB96_009052 [Tulasnella sp. 330]